MPAGCAVSRESPNAFIPSLCNEEGHSRGGVTAGMTNGAWFTSDLALRSLYLASDGFHVSLRQVEALMFPCLQRESVSRFIMMSLYILYYLYCTSSHIMASSSSHNSFISATQVLVICIIMCKIYIFISVLLFYFISDAPLSSLPLG